MGISGFQKWLCSTFPDAITVAPANQRDAYAHVAFDMNQLCHVAARRASDLQALCKLLFREVDATLRVVNPTASIFFAFDGPAPAAKLLTQRRRRAKEAARPPKALPRHPGGAGQASGRDRGRGSDRDRGRGRGWGRDRGRGNGRGRDRARGGGPSERRRTSEPTDRTASSSAVPAVTAVDRVGLTPGLDLMHAIGDALRYYAHSRLQTNPRFSSLDIRISGPDVPGEGELKIFDWLNTHVAPASPDRPAPESVLVVGSDADIVLQALATVSMQNLFIFIRNSSSQSGSKSFAKRTNTFISVWQIACALHSRFPRDSLAVRLDLIILAVCAGNDYVPKLRGVTVPRLWKRYNTLRLGSPAAAHDDAQARASPAPKAARPRAGVAQPARGGLGAAAQRQRPPPFADQTLVNPVTRTFNWPFLCALLDRVGARVPDIAKSLANTRAALEQQRLLELSASQGRLDTAPKLAKSDPTTVGVQPVASEGSAFEDGEFLEEEEILYTGNEDGHLDFRCREFLGTGSDDDSCELVSDDDSESESESDERDDVGDEMEAMEDFEGEEEDDEHDPDEAHIETLVAISGSTSKYFDTVEWLRTLLFTLQMYIDGFCPDHHYAYTKPYAPSSAMLCDFIRSNDYDPHEISAPVSAAPPLTPLKAGLAMTPLASAHVLAPPLKHLLLDPNLAGKIFREDQSVCFEELHAAVDRIPLSEFSPEVRRRAFMGQAVLLRRSRSDCDVPCVEQGLPTPPGFNFPPLAPHPVVFFYSMPSTSTPPCLPWPTGFIDNMLARTTRRRHGYNGVSSRNSRRGTSSQEPRGRGGGGISRRTGDERTFGHSTGRARQAAERRGTSGPALRHGLGKDRSVGRGTGRRGGRGSGRGSGPRGGFGE